MLKIQPNPTFKAKVALTVAGQAKPAEVTIEFKHLTVPEIKAAHERLEGCTDYEVLVDLVVGWEGVDAAFSHDALEQLCLNYPVAGREIFTVFQKSLLESRTKN